MMWIIFMLLPLYCFSTPQAHDRCENVLPDCRLNNPANWTRCFEERIGTCVQLHRKPGLYRQDVKSSEEADASPTSYHRVRIPSSALQRSRGAVHEDCVQVVVTIINSTYFTPPLRRGRMGPPQQPVGEVLGEWVLVVKAGNSPVANLSQPVELFFKHDKTVQKGDCVFWQEPGHWSTDGCNTTKSDEEFICSCNHLSFFAVLVNPDLSVDEKNAINLSYITYVGSALSVLFAFFSLLIYIGLQSLFNNVL